jgi:hypothetical protein
VAGELAGRLNVRYLELDSVYHQPGWVPLPKDEFRQAVAAAAAGNGWVIDGNYSAARDLAWAQADTARRVPQAVRRRGAGPGQRPPGLRPPP